MNAQTTATRAPKGGVEIMGVFYKGGQFLPANEPQRGKYNSSKRTAKKQRKVEIAPYNWVVAPDGQRSIFSLIGGTTAKYNHETKTLSPINNPQVLKYMGTTLEATQSLCDEYNNGNYFTV